MKGIVVTENTGVLNGLLEDYESVYVVYDANVKAFAESDVIANIPEGRFKGAMSIAAGEEFKTLKTVGKICRWLLQQGADRGSGTLVLAVGGGITTDITGFAASVYERGVKCAYVPTTLLAQVDASVGGKTGVNLDSYKNMVGTFKLPVFTLICPKPLLTLPKREFLCGAAELLKSFIIEDGGWYEKAVSFLGRYSRGEADASDPELAALVEAAVAVKHGIVSRDFLESGERRKLNLGHTFAHAIEHLSQHEAAEGVISAPVPHGEAVAMGMVLSADLSEKLGVAKAGTAARIRRDLHGAGLPVCCPYPVERLKGAMAHDKKAQGAAVNFVLVEDIGSTVVRRLELSTL